MLFGLISKDNFGSRVRGRAGSDLNGVLMFTLLIPLMAWLVSKMVSEGQASARQLIVIAVVFLLGSPLIYWSAHKERKDAEPLVRFLRKALAPPNARSPSTRGRRSPVGLRLILNGEYLEDSATDEAAQSAFMRVGNGDFLIIEATPQNYLQTASRDGGFVLEVRRGGPGKHYRAVRKSAGDDPVEHDKLTYDEVSAALASYISGDDLPKFLHLEPIDVS